MAMGREGASRAEWCAELDISFQTLRNWEETYPEFLESATRARQLSQAWWEKQGRFGIWNPKFNASAYSLQVRNRFPSDWTDKQSHEHSGPEGGPIEYAEMSDDEVKQRSAQLRNRLIGLGANGSNGNGKR